MRAARRNQNRAKPDSGYALLLVMFFSALLVISLAAVAQTSLSAFQRERETEMVWRGQQYARGIRLYYNKMRRFPTSLDDLTKPKTGIRFMRQAYKDPMNRVDGSWRLIYVGPSGQLIGSLNQYTIGSGGASTMGSLASTPSVSAGFSPVAQGPSRTANSFNAPAFGSNLPGSSGPTTSLAAPGNANGIADGSSANTTDQGDTGTIFGGNIIGVGSKVNKTSFMVYQKARNYRLFEFVWDPSKGTATVGNGSVGIGTPAQTLNGITPAGTNPSDSPFTPGKGTPPNPGSDPLLNQNAPQN